MKRKGDYSRGLNSKIRSELRLWSDNGLPASKNYRDPKMKLSLS